MQIYHNYFGSFGGRYVAEVLRGALDDLESAYIDAMSDNTFLEALQKEGREFIGRPTPLICAENTTGEIGGARIYIKQEGLAATGAHKINNALGQALLAKRMGKKRIIAETGAGQHGVAVAAVCARLGLPCRVYMGEVDIARQHPNVFSMELYGAEVVPVSSGTRTLKDAVNEALRDWAGSFADTHYLIGSALGPSPFPDMVREFQSVIGKELQEQMKGIGEPVEALIACVGGGSNALGFFAPFLDAERPRLIGVEAGGRGNAIGDHASRMNGKSRTGIVQGYKSKFLLDSDGQVQHTHSISAGLDYPGIGPQLARLEETGRVEFHSVQDDEALRAMQIFARNEGLIFALESAHAAAYALDFASSLPPDRSIIVNMSGRGDKDIFISAKHIQPEAWAEFLEQEFREIRCNPSSAPSARANPSSAASAHANPSSAPNAHRPDTRANPSSAASAHRPDTRANPSAANAHRPDTPNAHANPSSAASAHPRPRETLLMAHMVAFFPDKKRSYRIAKALIEEGARYLEIQFPFSDPSADGPLIEKACHRALSQGFTIEGGFDLISELMNDFPQLKEGDTEIFLMTYANIVFTYGLRRFVEQAHAVGLRGLIVPDMPFDSDEGLKDIADEYGLRIIPVVSSNTRQDRIRKIQNMKTEYIYCALRTGITGARTELGEEHTAFLDRVASGGAKILAGFGVVDREQVLALADHVHAVVAGSVFFRAKPEEGDEKHCEMVIRSRARAFLGHSA